MHGDAPLPELERVVDRLGRDGRAPAEDPGRARRVLDRAPIDEGVGSAGDLLQRDVGLAHELLDGQLGGRVAVSQRGGGAALVVEGEAVVAAARRVVQLVAQAPEQVARRPRLLDLARRQEAALSCFSQARHLVPDASDPERGLQVAQAALALLEVRLQQPHRAAVTLPSDL